MTGPGSTVVLVGIWRTETMERWSRLAGNTGKVIIIEAYPENAYILTVEAERRELDNVTILTKGAWREPGQTILQVSSLSKRNKIQAADSYSPRNPDDNYEQEITIEVDTVDHMLSELGISRVDTFYLTVSGAELEVLQGMKKTLCRPGTSVFVRAILIQSSTEQNMNQAVSACLQDQGLHVCMGRDEPKRNGSNVFATFLP